MKKLLIYLTALIFTNLITAQTTLYKKTIGTKTIELQNDLKIILTNNKGEKIILQEYSKNHLSNEFEENIFNIIDVDIKDDSVYILYYNVGLVDLKVYNFTIDKNFTINSYFIDENILLSYQNFGGTYGFGNMKWINSNLYMPIVAGQQYGPKTNGLYVFKKGIKKINVIKFPKDDVVKIPNDRNFRTLNLDTNKDEIITELKKALLLNDSTTKVNNIKYLGYINDYRSITSYERANIRLSGNTYFYYKIDNSKMKIAKYSNGRKMWYLGTYKEEEITYPKKE